MSLHNRVVLPLILITLALLAGCSSSGAPAPTPPPGGGFSKSDLKGTYVFSTSGLDPNFFYFTMAGMLMADGNGGIGSGTIDINDSGSGQAFGQAISGKSNYSVGVDGRGKVNLVDTPLGTITFDFVLNSSAGGLITEFDGNGTGSGTLELQSATITQAQMMQGYAFSVTGSDSGGNPLSGAGAFSLDVNGNIIGGTGVHDFNDATIIYSASALGGSVTLGAGGGSGTAILTTALGTLNFNFYVIDANHIKLIETDPLPSVPVLSGDAFLQASIPTGTLVFTMAGDSSSGPLAFGGFMTSSGAGQTSNGLEDENAGGLVSSVQIPFQLNYIAPVNGRSTLALTNFSGGPTQLAVYPFTNGSKTGLLMLETDSFALSAGVAYLQTNTALGVPPQGYGLNLSGVSGVGSSPFELDDIAEFATTSAGNMSGLLDENDQGSPVPPQAIIDTGSTPSVFVQDSPVTGRGEAQFNTNGANTLFDIVFYTVDGTNTIFIETDSTQVAVGSFQLQNSGAKKTGAAARPLPVRPMAMPHPALRRSGNSVVRGK